MEEDLMQDFKVSYDDNEDILYLAKEGEEEEIFELAPGEMSSLTAPAILLVSKYSMHRFYLKM